MKTVIVIQARVGSSRLPGKVLLPLAGATLLERLVERVRSANVRAGVVVATTTLAEDDAIESLCASRRIFCFRGHPTDLLDRHYRAARAYDAELVLKIPSDCPLVDPRAIEAVVDHVVAREGELDYVSNLHPASWPDGNDVEAMTIDALAVAHARATRSLEREHTTPFFWERPHEFAIGNVLHPSGVDRSMTYRFVVDYEADYAFVRAIYDELYRGRTRIFGEDRIFALLEQRPYLAALNAQYRGVNWYRHHLGELATIRAGDTRPAPGERMEL